MRPEFVGFKKIERWKEPLECIITQKLHGTNAHILIEWLDDLIVPDSSVEVGARFIPQYNVTAGSRTRWLEVGDDNYGFAKWVKENEHALIQLLGPGHHFGEWCGPGINSGEGLAEKTFVLFNHWEHKDKQLPKGVAIVPVLYEGRWTPYTLAETMGELKENGSKLVPGFMRPEGCVMYFNGTSYKSTFEQEETAWKKPDKEKITLDDKDVAHLLQPIRMEKLISRDERYKRNFPESLSDLVSAYVKDLKEEGQLPENEDERKAVTKKLGKFIFPLAKQIILHGIDDAQRTD